jgi:HlyD family secretion protein
MKTKLSLIIIASLIITSCDGTDERADAYGNFEATETIISAQMPGSLTFLNVQEGNRLDSGVLVGLIDTMELHWMKQELIANRNAISSQSEGIVAQLDVLRNDLSNLKREKDRAEKLLKAGATTQQQLDDLEGKIKVVKSQMISISTQNAGIISQVEAVDAKMEQVDEKINKSLIINPISGQVLAKTAEAHEYVGPGKPLYRIADTDHLDLRAYVSGDQLPTLKIGESYSVKTDLPDGTLASHSGILIWVSTETEFTPKTIQTRDERVNMVYAVNIRVPTDGTMNIGMPGE